MFLIKLEAEVTVTVHRVLRCTNFVVDSDRHLDRLNRNKSKAMAKIALIATDCDGTLLNCSKLQSLEWWEG